MATETIKITIPITVRVEASDAQRRHNDHATAPEMDVTIKLRMGDELVSGSVTVVETDGRWSFDPGAQDQAAIFSDELLKILDRCFDADDQSDLRATIEEVAAKEASEAASRPSGIKTVAAALNIWNKANDAGEGYSVGEEGDSPTEAADREEFTIIDVDAKGACQDAAGACLVRDRTGQLVLIGDANGPWACLIDANPAEDASATGWNMVKVAQGILDADEYISTNLASADAVADYAQNGCNIHLSADESSRVLKVCKNYRGLVESGEIRQSSDRYHIVEKQLLGDEMDTEK